MTIQNSFPHDHASHSGYTHSIPAGSLGSHIHTLPHAHTITTSTVVDLYPEVEIEVDDTGHYVALVRDKSKEGRVFNKITIPMIMEGEYWSSLYFYTIKLTPEQLIAVIKIFTDRWVFVTGDDREKHLIEYCEDELEKRKKCSPFLLHIHEIPSHSHGFAVSDGAHTHHFSMELPYVTEWRIPAS